MTETVEEVTPAAEKTAPACCQSEHEILDPRWTPEERAANRARREKHRAKAAEILEVAYSEALIGHEERAKVLVEIASAWDSLGY